MQLAPRAFIRGDTSCKYFCSLKNPAKAGKDDVKSSSSWLKKWNGYASYHNIKV